MCVRSIERIAICTSLSMINQLIHYSNISRSISNWPIDAIGDTSAFISHCYPKWLHRSRSLYSSFFFFFFFTSPRLTKTYIAIWSWQFSLQRGLNCRGLVRECTRRWRFSRVAYRSRRVSRSRGKDDRTTWAFVLSIISRSAMIIS